MDEKFQPRKDFKWKCDFGEEDVVEYIGGLRINLPSIILENMGEVGVDELVSRGNTDVQRLKEFDGEVNKLIKELNEDDVD